MHFYHFRTDHDPSRSTLSSRWLWSASSLNCDSLGGGGSLSGGCNGDCFTPYTSTTYSSSSGSSGPQLHNMTIPASVTGKNGGRRRRHPSLPSLASLSVDHFVTVARRKVAKPKSPCAQKIAAQRERGRRTLRRSSSLLCLGMDSCAGLDDLLNGDYEDLSSSDWRHTSKIDVLVDIPKPPPYDPPPPPTPPPNPTSSNQSTPSHTPRPPMPLPQSQNTPTSSSSVHPKSSSSEFSQQNSSSGNSTLTGSEEEEEDEDEEEEEEVYMVVRDHRRELTKTITRAQTRKQVCRSLTWASPTPRSSSSPPAASRTSGIKDKGSKDIHVQQRRPQANRHQPVRAATVRIQNRPRQIERRVTYRLDSPPPSLRKHHPSRPQIPLPVPVPMLNPQSYNGHLNILNYSDFMNRRLKYPEGTSRLDRHSLTTGQLCGPWYDLWGDDPSVADV